LEGRGMIIDEKWNRVAEFKKGVRDGHCTTYTNGEVYFDGICKVEPDGFG
jgi:hypothetical protein